LAPSTDVTVIDPLIENKIVADFYARLFPWIDHARAVRLCQDDGGAGAVALPDLCFYFLGGNDELRVEFKTWYPERGGHIGCTRKQGETWRPSVARGPHFWIAAERGSTEHYACWSHDDQDFQQAFQSSALERDVYRIRVPKPNLSLAAVFIQLMDSARERGMLT